MKQYIKIVKAVGLGSLLIALNTGCDKIKDFKDTNVNPNGSSEVLTSALLTNVEANIGGIAASLQPGYYCQYFSEPTYPGTSLYNLPQINSVGTYSGVLMDCQLIINKNADPATAGLNSVAGGGDSRNQIAIATILKSYIFWTVTDRWGDMPYSEALKGVNYLTPKYDKQEDIYKGLLAELTTTVTTGFNDAGAPIKGDVIFGGNLTKWKKLANSLRMLMAIRLSKKYPSPTAYPALEFKAAMLDARGHIDANADNFQIAYPGGNYRNPWFSAGASSDNGESQTMTDALTGLGDSRISVYGSNNVGVPYGLATAAPTSTTFAKILEASKRTEASTQFIITAAQVWLAKAEAIELGWVTGDAKVAYETGVTASFAQWGLAAPGSYLTGGPANYLTGNGVASIGGSTVAGSNAVTGAGPSTAEKLKRIALQQWIANYPDGLQGWSNWRKTGVPDLKPTINAAGIAQGKIVRRYVYGVTEYALNSAALAGAIANLPGGDKQNSSVWWDR